MFILVIKLADCIKDVYLNFLLWITQIDGSPLVAYQSDDTPMLTYINTHAALEQMRNAANSTLFIAPPVSETTGVDSQTASLSLAVPYFRNMQCYGPRVMIVGIYLLCGL